MRAMSSGAGGGDVIEDDSEDKDDDVVDVDSEDTTTSGKRLLRDVRRVFVTRCLSRFLPSMLTRRRGSSRFELRENSTRK